MSAELGAAVVTYEGRAGKVSVVWPDGWVSVDYTSGGSDRLHSSAVTVVCEDDGEPLTAHIGGKPCVVGKPSTARAWYDLPMAVAMWSADGADARA